MSMPSRAASTACATRSHAAVGDVELHGLAAELRGHARRGVAVEVGRDHVRAAPRELSGDGGADACASAGDHCGTARERRGESVHCHSHESLPGRRSRITPGDPV